MQVVRKTATEQTPDRQQFFQNEFIQASSCLPSPVRLQSCPVGLVQLTARGGQFIEHWDRRKEAVGARMKVLGSRIHPLLVGKNASLLRSCSMIYYIHHLLSLFSFSLLYSTCSYDTLLIYTLILTHPIHSRANQTDWHTTFHPLSHGPLACHSNVVGRRCSPLSIPSIGRREKNR